MKKLLVLLVTAACAVCLAFGIAACTGGGNGGEQSGNQQSAQGGQNGGPGGSGDHEHNYIYKCDQTEHWQICTICGEEKTHGAHGVSDGVCETCGYVEKCTAGLEFTAIKENGVTVAYSVSNGTATAAEIFIPSFHDNLPVTAIGLEAFLFCDNIKDVTIGNGVTSIGERAFNSCMNLTTIEIPDSVISIGDWAFYNCANLEKVYITNIVAWCNIDFRGISTNPLYYADNLYLDGQLVTELEIPQGVTEIKPYAFCCCASLTSVTIGNDVTSIGGGAFA